MLVRKLSGFLHLSTFTGASILLTMRRMRSKQTLATAAVSAAIVMLVPTAALSATKTVTARSTNTWGPSRIEINRGDTVRWSNPSSPIRIHTVLAYGGNWSKNVRLNPGDATTQRFREAGTYKFRCQEHSTKLTGQPCTGMCGVVKVLR